MGRTRDRGQVVQEVAGLVGTGGDPARSWSSSHHVPTCSGSPSCVRHLPTPAMRSWERRRSHRWVGRSAPAGPDLSDRPGPRTARRSADVRRCRVRHAATVSSIRTAIRAGLHAAGEGDQLDSYCKATSMDSSAASVALPRTTASSMFMSRDEARTSLLAPPRAPTPPVTASMSGWVSPYSNRGANSSASSTVPSRQRARRSSTCGAPAPRS